METLRALGLVATTNPMGASSWRAEYVTALEGRRVVLCPDYDLPGMRRVRQIRKDLAAAGIEFGVIDLPGLAGPKGPNRSILGSPRSEWTPVRP